MFIPSWQEKMLDRAARHVLLPVWVRADGGTICTHPGCGLPYRDHPQAVPHITLTLLCDGRYVKL